ncbi:hypothetical protein EVAR_60261_1 [Eumeta japonica]|uniref:Uncharacterized protein n=1 Tax=Eumeta variegata TaxID=151549 RepID=A0A4C1Z3W0_EUMVA|nr:hypothetical protein EVAR_60261_1 [Eumeta japonica]
MKVNVGKTKVMVFQRGESTTKCDIVIEDENVEQVKEFVYLDNLFTNDRKHDRDIKRKVNAGNEINGALLAIMNSKSDSRQVRLAIHNGFSILTCMYGSGTKIWKKNGRRINAVEMRSLRSMCRVSRKDRCRNSHVREWCGLKENLVTGMLRWIGYLERMNESRLTKQIYRANVCDEKIDRGRLRKSYADHIGGILK